MEFTKWARFERMGAFAYSEEEGTYSEIHYNDDIADDIKYRKFLKICYIKVVF